MRRRNCIHLARSAPCALSLSRFMSLGFFQTNRKYVYIYIHVSRSRGEIHAFLSIDIQAMRAESLLASENNRARKLGRNSVILHAAMGIYKKPPRARSAQSITIGISREPAPWPSTINGSFAHLQNAITSLLVYIYTHGSSSEA